LPTSSRCSSPATRCWRAGAADALCGAGCCRARQREVPRRAARGPCLLCRHSVSSVAAVGCPRRPHVCAGCALVMSSCHARAAAGGGARAHACSATPSLAVVACAFCCV
jgi:hypothetical protein